ncbi:MAG TPA: DUF2510 domain-containing protein [Mycobacteriales bacterium]|nr:DUF2510 domain-containing protein [Mycobacteriales bacterium]
MTAPAPGWYPDPGGAAPYRWWNGQAWTTATHDGTTAATLAAPSPPAVPGSTAAPGAVAGYGATGGYPAGQFGVPQQPMGTGAPAETPATAYGTRSPFDSQGNYVAGTRQSQTARNNTLFDQNQYAFFTFIALAISIFLLLSTGVTFLVITPMVLAGASRSRGEALSSYALGAAVLALVIGVASLTHHV